MVIVVEILTKLLKLKPRTPTPTPLTRHTHPFSKSESNPNPNPLFSPITLQVAEQSATPVLSTIDQLIPDTMEVLLFRHRGEEDVRGAKLKSLTDAANSVRQRGRRAAAYGLVSAPAEIIIGALRGSPALEALGVAQAPAAPAPGS